MNQPKRVAAIITEYRRHSHADLIVGKILEGFHHDGKDFPQMRLASMYIDQFSAREKEPDTGRAIAKRFNIPLYERVEGAITLGRNEVPIDGVLIIAEHGRYPTNDRGQILYPRRQFFETVTNVLARHKKSVPIFNDKHLSYNWRDAKWMYDRARELNCPFMAGSSLPVTWRRPDLQLELNCDLVEAVQNSYGAIEGYGFHALEALQCMVERRRGGETGVRAVRSLQGEAIWEALDKGEFSKELFELAIARCPSHSPRDMRKEVVRSRESALHLIEYRDGLKAAIPVLNGWIYEGDGGAFTFAGRVRNQRPVSCQFYLQQPDPFAHFCYQVRAIDNMIQTGHPSYPVERTLLTTGILEALMISRAEKSRRVETPHLDISYRPGRWPHATDAVPARINR